MHFSFEITYIQAGWIEVAINSEADSVVITNSYYMSNDAPRILLQNIAELCNVEAGDCWLCWHDEPGANIIHVIKDKDLAKIEVYHTKKESYMLPFEGETLYKDVEEKYFELEISFINLARLIIKAFGIFSSREKLSLYEKEWMPFPHTEYRLLKSNLKNLKSQIAKSKKII